MNEELKNLLCVYLGELLFKFENEYDWINRDGISEKINAVNVLLGIADRKQNFGQLVEEFYKSEIERYEK
jgi:hypothetical protein